MDEYRPYPTNQPQDDSDDDAAGAEGAPAASGQTQTAGDRSSGGAAPGTTDYAIRPASGVRGGNGRELAEVDDDADESDEEDAPAGNRRDDGDAGSDEREARPAPNLDHPGGHLTGTVARLNRPRRFGFLRTEDGMEIFFHASALEAGPSAFDALRAGQAVEFDCHQDEQGRGLAATLVQVAGPPPADSQPRAARPSREERRASRDRGERGERGDRQERGERATRDRWRVVVLREDNDTPLESQLERLLNERGAKPGHVTLNFFERDGGAECWVALHSGDDTKR